MLEETNKRLIVRYYHEMWNMWDFALIDELLSSELSFRGSLGSVVRGRAGFRDYMRAVQLAFPNFHNEINEMLVESNRVAARLSYTGTHRGTIFGVSPTERNVSYAGAGFFRIEDARIVDAWILGDVAQVLRQLGSLRL